MKNQQILLTALLFLLTGCTSPIVSPYTTESSEVATIQFNDTISLKVLVVRTDADKKLGLGGRESIGEDEGMLFVYNKPEQLTFWMKNMLFPIDIIWINEDKVVEISSNLHISEYPNSPLVYYSSKTPVQYVLETRAGWAAMNNISIGDSVISPIFLPST